VDSLPLFRKSKERYIFISLCFFLFSINLLLLYKDYLHFTKNEVFKTEAVVSNIYEKNNFSVLKLKTPDLSFFTSVDKDHQLHKLNSIQIYLLTTNISFFQYIKGFYAKSFNIRKIPQKDKTTKELLNKQIKTQHSDIQISSLYSALYLAIPIDNGLRDLFSAFGISHLIAISGFHLGIISLVLYFILNLVYAPLHQRLLPYRNKKYDIMITVSFILFGYLLLTGMVPSLLRAFAMFVFALFLLRSNIKILSFETLFIIILGLTALFPKLLFSLSFWFSVSGVFYIYLFLHYFKGLNKYLQLLLFNFWIYLAMNPIVHYFFPVTSVQQLLSPILTILFSVFYPVTLFLHFTGFGDLFDEILLFAVNIKIDSFDISTPVSIFTGYIALSLFSVFNRYAFYLLNIFIVLFSLYLYL
jgi:competence protein ComEC